MTNRMMYSLNDWNDRLVLQDLGDLFHQEQLVGLSALFEDLETTIDARERATQFVIDMREELILEVI
jgi:hypothetical protein